MQYPVPQFTEVEDKLIGSLTLKQFGIVFGAGVIVFLAYSATKSLIVLVFFAIIVGIPALGVAFAKINGRPLYKMLPFVIKFFTAPREMVFHKDAANLQDNSQIKNVETAAPQPVELPKEQAKTKLQEINRLLEQQEREEEELVRQLR